MKIILTGTGTSQGVPIIGCDCKVCRSKNPRDKRLRTAALITQGNTYLAIDAGPDFRQQMLSSKTKRLDGVLLTHAHNDHIIGLDDVRPFNFRQKENMKIFATTEVQAQVKSRFAYVFEKNPYPGAPRLELVPISKSNSFSVAGIEVVPIEAMHGRLPVLGFRFGEITYLTDVKTIEEKELNKAKNSKILILSALQKKEHHSHLNLEQALELIKKLNPAKAYLTHIGHGMGLHDVVSKELPQNVEIAYDGLEVEA